MARRPKRNYADELVQLAAIANGARTTCAALVVLCPEIAEFLVARKMLEDAGAELQRKLAEVRASEVAPAAVETRA